MEQKLLIHGLTSAPPEPFQKSRLIFHSLGLHQTSTEQEARQILGKRMYVLRIWSGFVQNSCDLAASDCLPTGDSNSSRFLDPDPLLGGSACIYGKIAR